MARGGITKTDIERVRIAILARGEHASIDAVRVELGNTGSRSTIHRYMRELEDSEVQSLAGEERLSQELKQFVGQLAGRLHQEADAVIAQARDGHAQERAQREAQLSAAARFKNGVFWVPVDEPMPTGKRQLIEGVE